MAALILLLAVRTYEETAVALARSNESLRTVGATVMELTDHTESGRSGGGQDGGSGDWFVHTEHTIELRVGDQLETVDGVPGRRGGHPPGGTAGRGGAVARAGRGDRRA
ncbi:hypothetical protein [Streptomyces sp. NPDC002685]|uniref:hypothetical protein n=1 Tax=Streptomyces sp. NPDC002685 TaxID=3154540 RepID=UPI00331AD4B5